MRSRAQEAGSLTHHLRIVVGVCRHIFKQLVIVPRLAKGTVGDVDTLVDRAGGGGCGGDGLRAWEE